MGNITFRIDDLVLDETEMNFLRHRYPCPDRKDETIQDRIHQVISDTMNKYNTSVPPMEATK